MLQESFAPRLGIVGGGRAAWAFGSLWRDAGWPIAGIALRAGSPSRVAADLDTAVLTAQELVASADIVLVAVSDRALEPVARSCVEASSGQSVIFFHPAGAATSDVFEPAALRFSLHPLRALPAAGMPGALIGSFFGFEGSDGTEEIARRIVAIANGRMAVIPKESKLRYHAAAVFASNYVALLCDVARDVLTDAGAAAIGERDVAELAQSAIDNWKTAAPGAEFTGPASRGDRETVESHMRALEPLPEARALYATLARELIRRAAARGAHREELEALKRWLDAVPLP